MVLFVTLGSLAAGGLFATAWLLVPAKYTTYATLLVSQRDPTNLPVGPTSNEGDSFPTYLKTQSNLIKNRKVIGQALLDPKAGLAQLPMLRDEEDPAAYLENLINTEVTDTSNSALRVTLSGDDPVQITTIVNAVVDSYMKEVNAWREVKTNRIKTLEDSQSRYEAMLSNKLKHYDDETSPGADPDPKSWKQKLRLNDYLGVLRDRNVARAGLNSARSALTTAQGRLDQFDANPPPMPVVDLAPAIDNDPSVRFKALAAKRFERDRNTHLQQASRPDPAKVAEMTQRLEAAVADLEAAKAQARKTIETAYRGSLRAQFEDNVKKAQDQVRYAELQEKAANDLLAADYKEFKDLDEAGVQKKMSEVVKEKDDIEMLRKDVFRIKDSIMGLNVDLHAPDRVRVWHKAEVPSKKDIRKQAAIAGAAGLLGLGLVGGLISLYEIRKKRVYGPGDPLFKHKLPLIGCLPDCVAPASPKGDSPDPAGRAFLEAVDKVKAVLCRQMQRRKMQAVLVTSAAPGEGKSATAWHLALSLARSDRRTLFIDGNLRNPGLHNHFDIASHPGLSELLRGERPMQEVVQRTALDNLWCIAAGVCDDSARHALDKDALRHLFDRARRDFDYVVIDGCSIREAVDSLYLAQRADATVLAVRTFQSSAADVERACERLTQLGTPLLGAVLTDPSGAGSEL
jgi:receptor protein-tyrosine kinase